MVVKRESHQRLTKVDFWQDPHDSTSTVKTVQWRRDAEAEKQTRSNAVLHLECGAHLLATAQIKARAAPPRTTGYLTGATIPPLTYQHPGAEVLEVSLK